MSSGLIADDITMLTRKMTAVHGLLGNFHTSAKGIKIPLPRLLEVGPDGPVASHGSLVALLGQALTL